MDVPRSLLAAVVCCGFAAPLAQAQDVDPEAVAAEMARAKGPAKPWKHVRGFGRLLDLRKPPVVIDEPGLYAIDRNWDLAESANGSAGLIQITAEGVTLDLHGFDISADPGQGTLLVITGFAEVRNGGISACCTDGAVAVHTARSASLHHLSLFSHDTMTFDDGMSITDSDLGVRVEMQFGSFSQLLRNTITCNRGGRCVSFLGESNTMTDNTLTLFQGGGVYIAGDRNVAANNVIDARNAVDHLEVFEIAGDRNVVRSNTFFMGGFDQAPLWLITGTQNTLDGNIAAGGRARIGMEFTADGNYYGNNRMAAEVPFALGGTVQADWGGNVGY